MIDKLNPDLAVTVVETAFPRPLMQRDKWMSLNGTWDFCNGREYGYCDPGEVVWDARIIVPFSPETAASGVEDTGFYAKVWYRRTWIQPELEGDERLRLNFEAVDWRATVWVNGKKICSHEGGYTPFGADITDALVGNGVQEVIVCAEDDPADLAKPRGKQDWKLEPHSIWYPRTTGIWQTVWLETVPVTRIKTLHWACRMDEWEIGIEAAILEGDDGEGLSVHDIGPELQLAVRLQVGDQILANDTYNVVAGEVHRRIALSDPGIDDYRNTLLWSPSSPTLIDADVELRDASGKVLDRARSYTALRSVTTQGNRFILNGRPISLRLVLDQGYWPESGLTAPNDAALLEDVVLAKKMGFNGVRKHQKIESARYLYWADRLGLMVWEEMPSAYRYTTMSIQRLIPEWLEVLHRDKSHPCIIAWVPFNESWGVPDLPDSPSQRHYVQSLYHLTKALDPTRPVVGNDGWESIATDILGIHDYDDQPERLGVRYGINDIEARLFKRERPGGRQLLIGTDKVSSGHPIVLTEFGGIAFSGDHEDTWGYSRSMTSTQLAERYALLLETVRSLPALAGFCYTQFTDTYQEANGLLYADRMPKIPFDKMSLATSGALPDFDTYAETIWRQHILQQ